MNILLINHYAGSDLMGMEYRPFYLAREWIADGHKVTLVAADFSHLRNRQPVVHSNLESTEEEGVRFRWLRTNRYDGNGAWRLINMATFVGKLLFHADCIAREERPELVICSSTYPLDIFPGAYIARKTAARLVFEVHDLWPLTPILLGGYSPRHPYIRALQAAEDWAYRHADAVVSLLPNAQDYMVGRGLEPAKFVHVPNGIPASRADAAGNDQLPSAVVDLIERERARGRFLIGFAGGINLNMALETLLSAAAPLQANGVSFFIAGDGSNAKRLRERATRLPIDNFHMLGRIPKASVPEFLSHMDALAIPWHRNPLYRFGVSPNKVFDYMLSGKPILQASEASNDLLAEAQCGFTVAPEDPAAFADAVLRLRSLPAEERRRLGANGRRFVLENHDCRVLARRFLRAVAAQSTDPVAAGSDVTAANARPSAASQNATRLASERKYTRPPPARFARTTCWPRTASASRRSWPRCAREVRRLDTRAQSPMSGLGELRITQADVHRFAALSGDFNPLHVDAVAARRMVFGSTVPHGILILLAALDLAVARERPLRLGSLTANFAAPAALDTPLDVSAESSADGSSIISVRQQGRLVQSISATFTPGAFAEDDLDSTCALLPRQPRELAFDEAIGREGTVPLVLDRTLLAALFPALSSRLSAIQIATLLASTRIVGMECPGLHSIFGSLKLSFGGHAGVGPPRLDYRTERTDSRTGLVRLAVDGPGASGVLTAFFRPPPVVQPSAAAIRDLVVPGEFAGQRALIVGGSRGLGEITAKILAAAGGEIWITYARGAADAAAVVADIGSMGGRCAAFAFDATRPSASGALPKSLLSSRPSHLYFFATPAIQLRRGGWSRSLFDRYCTFYVDGVVAALKLVEELPGDRDAPLTVFYPSTVFLDRPQAGAGEYSAAKAAGEALCHDVAASRPWLRIHCPRLPPLKTDQTNSLLKVGSGPGDPVAVLLDLLREAHRR